MRVLIVNTYEHTGGAAVAAGRLMDALNGSGVKAKMLVAEKETHRLTVAGLPHPARQRWHFLWERWCIFRALRFSRKRLFEVDIANAGTDITVLPEFKEADVIHLSWVNQGMLSTEGIRRILATGKPVVWTMHDLWPATAICHYARQCPSFKTGCHHCRLLPGGGSEHDLASRVWRRKQAAYKAGRISFVACSRWLADQAARSALLADHSVTSIPNPIDTRVFCRRDKAEARRQAGLPGQGRIVLFVSQRVTDERKGMGYFVEALRQLVQAHPQWKDNTSVAILGGHAEEVAAQLPLPAWPLGYVADEQAVAGIYNAADAYVLPSLEDNLPNTLMEAMACGVPCVGFCVGGIPEMIVHGRNGYVARPRDAADLAEGIRWVLDEAEADTLQAEAVRHVARNYSQSHVAMQYIEVYNEALAMKEYCL